MLTNCTCFVRFRLTTSKNNSVWRNTTAYLTYFFKTIISSHLCTDNGAPTALFLHSSAQIELDPSRDPRILNKRLLIPVMRYMHLSLSGYKRYFLFLLQIPHSSFAGTTVAPPNVRCIFIIKRQFLLPRNEVRPQYYGAFYITDRVVVEGAPQKFFVLSVLSSLRPRYYGFQVHYISVER